MPNENRRERGSALIYAMVLIVMLLSFASASSIMSYVGQKAVAEGRENSHAFYAADSGAQLANYLLRTANGDMAATTLNETIGDADVAITINPLNADLYEITSVATTDDTTETVVMHVQFQSEFDMEGAVQVNIDEGVEVSADDMVLFLRSSTMISGQDHDSEGNLLADQSDATYGVALAEVPGAVDVGIEVELEGSAIVEGSPEGTTNGATGQVDIFNELLDYSRDNAELIVEGSVTLQNGAIGDYGTIDDPMLIYVHLGDNEQVLIRQNFVGYGTLVIEVDNSTTTAALNMEASSEWYGLVVLQFTGDAENPAGALVTMENHAQIVGGLSLNYTGDATTIAGDGYVYEAITGNASVLYSSEILANAVGIDQVVDRSARIISYRRDLPDLD